MNEIFRYPNNWHTLKGEHVKIHLNLLLQYIILSIFFRKLIQLMFERWGRESGMKENGGGVMVSFSADPRF